MLALAPNLMASGGKKVTRSGKHSVTVEQITIYVTAAPPTIKGR